MRNRQPAVSTSGLPAAIRIDIGLVTLEGYTAADRLRFTDAIRANLTEMASANRNYKSNLSIRRLDAGQVHAGASIEDVARMIATRLFERIDV